jgi:tetratricopeptide (TPR) repeat protein
LAQHALDRRSDIHATIDKFQRAAVLDTSYADAFSGLSLAVALSPYLSGGRSAPEVAPEVRRTADRALRLNPALAQPHVALGIVHLAALEWDSADVELRTAVRLRAPGDVEPLLQVARYLIFRGRPAESIKYLLLAKKTEPASALISGWLAYAYYVNRQMDSAVVERARAYQNDSTYIINLTTGPRILWKAGQFAEMRALLRQAPTRNAGALFLLAAIGDTAEAMSRLRAAQQTTPPLRYIDVLTAYTMLGKGDTAEALAALERLVDEKEEWATTESTLDPIFDSVRQSARFRALMRRLGLEDSPQPTTSVPPRR